MYKIWKFRAAWKQLWTKILRKTMLTEGNQGSQKHMKDIVIYLTLNIYVGGEP